MASIDELGGLSIASARSLRQARIRTTEALLKRCSTRRGRRELADRTGITEAQVVTWVNRADLMRIKGIGGEYANLLEACGVYTVKDLRRRSVASLTRKMTEINGDGKVVHRLPTEGMVGRWIAIAGEVEPVINR
jgi:predicted flap endonuclease-1-like 5' DNA nuclease